MSSSWELLSWSRSGVSSGWTSWSRGGESKWFNSCVIIAVKRVTFLCPVAEVQEFVEARRPRPGQRFGQADESAFPHAWVRALLMDPRGYKGHSFYIGVASEAVQAEYPDTQIGLTGRCKSGGFRKCIRIAQWTWGLGVGQPQVTAQVAGPQTQ